MKVNDVILLIGYEFIVIFACVETPVCVDFKRAVTADNINGQFAVFNGFEFLAVVVIINLHAVFFHSIFLSIAEHLACCVAFFKRVVGCAAYADCLNAECVLEFNCFGKLVTLEIVKADVAADGNKADFVKLCLDGCGICAEKCPRKIIKKTK